MLPMLNGLTNREAAEITGIHFSSIQRWKADPNILITEWEADRYAVKLGKHPSEFWPDWFNIETSGTSIRGRRKIA